MAELFVATHRASGSKVVLKRLLPSMEARADVVDLFLTEADVGTMLRHENVVRVLDAGDVDGRYFIVMEFVDGLDAEHVLADAYAAGAPVPVRVSCRIALDALRGLHAAHVLRSAQGHPFGLVHRDVSPDNLFINVEGTTKVADFGIAKLASIEGQTQAGLIKGKITYMSPEQVKGAALDGRADAFSLALVLFELLTHERPFAVRAGESELEALLRVRRGAVPGVRRFSLVVRAVARVVDKGLRATRWMRFSDCGKFADALEQAASDHKLLGGRQEVAEHVLGVRARRDGHRNVAVGEVAVAQHAQRGSLS